MEPAWDLPLKWAGSSKTTEEVTHPTRPSWAGSDGRKSNGRLHRRGDIWTGCACWASENQPPVIATELSLCYPGRRGCCLGKRSNWARGEGTTLNRNSDRGPADTSSSLENVQVFSEHRDCPIHIPTHQQIVTANPCARFSSIKATTDLLGSQ